MNALQLIVGGVFLLSHVQTSVASVACAEVAQCAAGQLPILYESHDLSLPENQLGDIHVIPSVTVKQCREACLANRDILSGEDFKCESAIFEEKLSLCKILGVKAGFVNNENRLDLNNGRTLLVKKLGIVLFEKACVSTPVHEAAECSGHVLQKHQHEGYAVVENVHGWNEALKINQHSIEQCFQRCIDYNVNAVGIDKCVMISYEQLERRKVGKGQGTEGPNGVHYEIRENSKCELFRQVQDEFDLLYAPHVDTKDVIRAGRWFSIHMPVCATSKPCNRMSLHESVRVVSSSGSVDHSKTFAPGTRQKIDCRSSKPVQDVPLTETFCELNGEWSTDFKNARCEA